MGDSGKCLRPTGRITTPTMARFMGNEGHVCEVPGHAVWDDNSLAGEAGSRTMRRLFPAAHTLKGF